MQLTLADALARVSANRPRAIAIVVEGQTSVTYGQLWQWARSVAGAVQAWAPGPRLAILLPNCWQWLACLYGAALSRSTAILLNPKLTVPELLYQIEQSDAGLVVTTDLPGRDQDALLTELASRLAEVRVVWIGSRTPLEGGPRLKTWEDWLRLAPAGPLLWPHPEDTAVLIYTSGTTASPKGVMLAHASVVRNAWYVGWCLGLRPGDRVFSAGPFCHSGGLTLHLVASALYGATVCSTPRFDPELVLTHLERHRCTHYSGIETLFLRLLEAPRFSPRLMASVRTGWSTGSPAVLRRIAGEVGVGGVTAVYGISEASPNVSICHWRDSLEHRLETAGRPHPWTQVKIVAPQGGGEVAAGEVGEITVRGYQVMQGYYRKPAETAAALASGWLHTGDLGRIRPDGYLEFVGRLKDIVRVGGENVSCVEVEDALYSLEGIELAAVLPREDPVYGEVPIAVVKVSPGLREEAGWILDRLRGRLARYKLPRQVLFVDALPLTSSGKVQKSLLRAQLIDQARQGSEMLG